MNKATDTAILLIYTGGTIGMVRNPESGTLYPFDFSQIHNQVPELRGFGYKIDTVTFSPLIDSSDVTPEFWIKLAEIIQANYENYDGFIILHGTDTMAYTASALSFILKNLQKPVILTGSQLPIGTLRTDGKENLITAIEIAAAKKDKQPLVPEVALYFENCLYRGNRTTKVSSEHFNAFASPNYPKLAEIGINIKYNFGAIRYPTNYKKLAIYKQIEHNVGVMKIYPGLKKETAESLMFSKDLKAIIMETYGAGNAPQNQWLLKLIKDAVKQNIIILNVTQCMEGQVDMNKYENGKQLLDAGVISGYDITFEAAITKLMFLLGNFPDYKEVRELLTKSIRGEIII
ncbi:MAG: type I asparaginase [Bacteroidales bacterium]